MPQQEKPSVYEFAGYRLDPASRRLTGRGGEALELRPRVFDTLLALVQASGTTLSRAELMSKVWPNTVVDENNLNQSIASLRKVLGKKPDGQDFIQTLPGRGYQFTEHVRRQDVSQDRRAAPSVQRELASKRIVLSIMPFVCLSNDPAHERMADGIQKALVTGASKFPEFDVHSIHSAANGRNTGSGVTDEVPSSGISYLMEGDLIISGSNYRVNVQLSDMHAGTTVWANRFENTYTDEIEAIDKVVQAILFEFYPTFHHYEKKLVSQKQPEDMTAWESFKMAVNPEHDRANIEQFDRALRYLDRALEIDPDFSEAHGTKPMFLAMRHWWSPLGDDEDVDNQLRFHAERALTLGAQQPWTIMNVSYVHGMLGEFDRAVKLASQAASMQPDSLQFQLAQATSRFYASGKADKHIPQLHELLASISPQNPSRPPIIMTLASAYAYVGKHDDAVETFDLDLGLASNFPESSVCALACHENLGHAEEAEALMRRVVSNFPGFDAQHFCRRNFGRWLSHPVFEEQRNALTSAVVRVQGRVKD